MLSPELIDYIISLTDLKTAVLMKNKYAIYKLFDPKICFWWDLNTDIRNKNNYAINKFYNPNLHTWDWAATYGYLDVIKWLHKNGIKGCSSSTMDYAAEHGYLDIVKWLHINRTEGCTKYAIDLAVKNGHLDVVEFLKNKLINLIL
jgi:hypothetical protein